MQDEHPLHDEENPFGDTLHVLDDDDGAVLYDGVVLDDGDGTALPLLPVLPAGQAYS